MFRLGYYSNENRIKRKVELWKKHHGEKKKFEYKFWSHTLAKYNVVLHLQGKVPPNEVRLFPPKPESEEVQIRIPEEDQKITFTIDHRAYVKAIKEKLRKCQEREINKIKKRSSAMKWTTKEVQIRLYCINMMIDFSQKMLIGE